MSPCPSGPNQDEVGEDRGDFGLEVRAFSDEAGQVAPMHQEDTMSLCIGRDAVMSDTPPGSSAARGPLSSSLRDYTHYTLLADSHASRVAGGPELSGGPEGRVRRREFARGPLEQG